METFPLMSLLQSVMGITMCWWRPVSHLPSLPALFGPTVSQNIPTLSLCHLSLMYSIYCAARASGGNEVDAALSFQAFSTLLSLPGAFLFDAADRTGFVCCSCPRLCQIKGQRLDSEATLLFILVQPRERSNKSRGNVVTREAERSLPTGRGKWREALSLKSPLLHIFAAKCHLRNQVR